MQLSSLFHRYLLFFKNIYISSFLLLTLVVYLSFLLLKHLTSNGPFPRPCPIFASTSTSASVHIATTHVQNVKRRFFKIERLLKAFFRPRRRSKIVRLLKASFSFSSRTIFERLLNYFYSFSTPSFTLTRRHSNLERLLRKMFLLSS